ncbi:MAG: hypothetical protein KAU46_13220 [Candidatus Aminicenantes bacterium]|nr:hypothetical protein [Candidatus Aminicenantes bacterium]
MTDNQMEKHVTLVAVLNIGFGILGVILAIFVLIGMIVANIYVEDYDARKIIPIAGTAVFLFLLITSIPEIIGGFGLLKRRPWARILILIVACLDLLWIPIGTIIGIYELWVLLQDKTVQLFNPASSKE